MQKVIELEGPFVQTETQNLRAYVDYRSNP